MFVFRLLLIIMFISVCTYTAFVVSEHGFGLLPIFFGDIATVNWPGQFNLDFSGFLILSGVWLAWRHHFSTIGIMLGFLGAVGGIPVLSAYLFFASFSVNGNVGPLLLGKVRAASMHP